MFLQNPALRIEPVVSGSGTLEAFPEIDYGVVIRNHRVDAAATEKLRSEIRRRRGWREVPAVQREDPPPATRKAA